ncbi:MAG TPA: hypothetical protein VM121_03790 [Acidimicrobiales bacterium]|nr:hypothetical protein [Acidimicrobiales bacterium]
MEVEPVMPPSFAVHVLAMLWALNGSSPDLPGFVMVLVLVTEPSGPSVPEVATCRASEVKMVAGPAMKPADGALAFCGLLEALEARVTTGVGPELPGVPKTTTELV